MTRGSDIFVSVEKSVVELLSHGSVPPPGLSKPTLTVHERFDLPPPQPQRPQEGDISRFAVGDAAFLLIFTGKAYEYRRNRRAAPAGAIWHPRTRTDRMPANREDNHA
ncbi:hypothetical protein, partial [Sinorhizobium sp. CCBAU 05631]|uniref:hypothetical protein n=1 Tax=Sinorhizobium sp. CCBAU 05631 TaxID=794846 RepID=UPI001AEBEB9E